MLIGGLQKLTLIDFPGKIAATVFTVGCNFFCPYCHNPDLVEPSKIRVSVKFKEDEILRFLEIRKNILEGVCITGGEPTIQGDLPDFIKRIKDLGLAVKLDTNGTNPDMLEKLLVENLLDYIAMDIKAPLEKYKEVVGRNVRLEDIQRSSELARLLADYEFRTTVLPVLHSREDILSIGRWLQGSKKYYLQQFRSLKTLDSAFEKEKPFEMEELAKLRNSLGVFFDECGIRE